jgi:hypothetical protein
MGLAGLLGREFSGKHSPRLGCVTCTYRAFFDEAGGIVEAGEAALEQGEQRDEGGAPGSEHGRVLRGLGPVGQGPSGQGGPRAGPAGSRRARARQNGCCRWQRPGSPRGSSANAIAWSSCHRPAQRVSLLAARQAISPFTYPDKADSSPRLRPQPRRPPRSPATGLPRLPKTADDKDRSADPSFLILPARSGGQETTATSGRLPPAGQPPSVGIQVDSVMK